MFSSVYQRLLYSHFYMYVKLFHYIHPFVTTEINDYNERKMDGQLYTKIYIRTFKIHTSCAFLLVDDLKHPGVMLGNRGGRVVS